jgi:ribosome assembly protein YihI (activator of Der GTPase)
MKPSATSGRGKFPVARNKRKTRQELNEEGRLRQRQKKHRGLASGTRAQAMAAAAIPTRRARRTPVSAAKRRCL